MVLNLKKLKESKEYKEPKELSEITRSLKILAKEINVPVEKIDEYLEFINKVNNPGQSKIQILNSDLIRW